MIQSSPRGQIQSADVFCGRNAPHLGDLSSVTMQNTMRADISGRRDVINRPPCTDISTFTSAHGQDADVTMDVPIKDIIESLPKHDERRRLLARDALASVDGFKMLFRVTYEYLFGMRVCFLLPRQQRRLECQQCKPMPRLIQE